jgi:hypothetical protein
MEQSRAGNCVSKFGTVGDGDSDLNQQAKIKVDSPPRG